MSLTGGAIQSTGGPATLTGTSYAVQNGTISVNFGDANGSALQKTNSATTVVLLGNNAYTGGTAKVQFVLSSGSGVINTNGYSAGLSSAISGVGGLTLIGGGGALNLSGSSTYSGNTSINGGTLQVGAVGAVPFGAGKGNVSLGSPGTLDLTGHTTAINGLSGSGVVNNSSATSVTFNVGNNNATSTFAGVIQNSNLAAGGLLALDKMGSGTLTLSSTGTYQGGTTVNSGMLIVTNDEGLEDGSNLYVGDPTALSMLPAAVVPMQVESAAAPPVVSPVPEPGTLVLIAAGAIAGIGIWRRKRTSTRLSVLTLDLRT